MSLFSQNGLELILFGEKRLFSTFDALFLHHDKGRNRYNEDRSASNIIAGIDMVALAFRACNASKLHPRVRLDIFQISDENGVPLIVVGCFFSLLTYFVMCFLTILPGDAI